MRSPAGGDLDRDAALGDRFDRGLVVVARIALGQRPGAAPDLDQVGVGEDVEEAGAGTLRQRVEVAAPDLVGIALALPDVPARVIDRGVADEVDRADHVVEVARLQQGRGAVFGGGDEVALDPEPQRRAADELAVGVEVVAGLFLPEGWRQRLERLGEAVDVLGDAQLGDPRLAGGREVAVDVLGGEVALRRRVRLVRAQVQVVVGQHEDARCRRPGPRIR